MHRILIADDDTSILDVVEYALKQNGFDVIRAKNGHDALDSFRSKNPDFIVLDINMPPPDGFGVLREIRKTSNVPVIFLTSREEEIDRVLGLEIGADDYVTKPFSPRELVARVKAILRRTSPGKPEDERTIEHGPLKLDEDRYLLYVEGKPVPLGKVEFNLVKVLLRRPGRVYSRNELLDLAWGMNYVATDRVVDTHIKRIRQKIRSAPSELDVLETVHGVGYRIRETIE